MDASTKRVPPVPTYRQITDSVMMVRPARFGPNTETAESNVFQQTADANSAASIQFLAADEFDSAVDLLRNLGVTVLVIDDTPDPVKSDAIFPNNWISMHHDGTVVTYPMFSPTRRREIRDDVIQQISQQFAVLQHWPLHELAEENQFLEGTGSLVLDHVNRLAFACRSLRTDDRLVEQFCERMKYRAILFDACDDQGRPIYHTNVMMSVGQSYSIICLESIPDTSQRGRVRDELIQAGKDIVEISPAQMWKFAGNMLELVGPSDRSLLVLSTTACVSLTAEQIEWLNSRSTLIPLNIPTIEKYGGGSVRCMIAEIFLDSR